MTPAEALTFASTAARLGRLRYTKHARERMEERGATRNDVVNACVTATVATHQRGDVWRLSGGVDGDGDVLVIIAGVDPDEVSVITVTG